MRHLIPVPPPHVGHVSDGLTAEDVFAVVGAITVAILACWLLWKAARWIERRLGLWISERTDGVRFWRHEAEVARKRIGDLQRQVNSQRDEIVSLQHKVRVTQHERELLRAQVDRLESGNVTGRYAYLISQLESNVPLRNDGRLRAVGEFAHELLKGLENQP